MYEEALLPPSLWLTVDAQCTKQMVAIISDSSKISDDEHPKDKAYNQMQNWGYWLENLITLSLGEEGNHDIVTSKSQKKKKGGGGRGSSSALYYEQFIRVCLFTQQRLISLSPSCSLSLPFTTFNSASFAWLAWGICIYVIQASAKVTDGAITMGKQCS